MVLSTVHQAMRSPRRVVISRVGATEHAQLQGLRPTRCRLAEDHLARVVLDGVAVHVDAEVIVFVRTERAGRVDAGRRVVEAHDQNSPEIAVEHVHVGDVESGPGAPARSREDETYTRASAFMP